jgi:hypothetical protein
MSGEEKFNTCVHRPDEQIEIYKGCPCKKQKIKVYQCLKLSIVNVQPSNCENCELYLAKAN